MSYDKKSACDFLTQSVYHQNSYQLRTLCYAFEITFCIVAFSNFHQVGNWHTSTVMPVLKPRIRVEEETDPSSYRAVALKSCKMIK